MGEGLSLASSLRIAVWMAEIDSPDFTETADEFMRRFRADYPMLSKELVRDIRDCVFALKSHRRNWARGELLELAALIAMEKRGQLPKREKPVSW